MKISKKMAVLLSFLLLLSLANFVVADDIETLRKSSKAFSQIAQQAIKSVVFVKVEKTIEVSSPSSPFGRGMPGFPGDPFGDDFFDRFFGTPRQSQPQQRRQQGQGSGFIVSTDGYIITNNHVVGGADKITVRLSDSREFQAEIIGADDKTDIAIIKIQAENLPAIELGDSDQIDIGEWVFAIGNPFGLSETITFGVVSAKGRSDVNIANYEDFIQTDAAINPGNSGGPLINLDGQVIGINTAIFSRSGGYMGIGFAIPVNMAKYVKSQLLETGQVQRGQLGVIIDNVSKELSDYFDLDNSKGVVVTEVLEGSPADKAGFKAGDIILQYDSKDINSPGQLRNMVGMTPPGSTAKVKIFRNGKEKIVKVTIEKFDGSISDNYSSEMAKQLGLTIENLDDSASEKGVLITNVAADSVAAQANIRPGNIIVSVNQKDIASVREFNEAIAPSKESKRVLLRIKDRNFYRFVVLSVK